MAAVGMYDMEHQCPTYAAMVLFCKHPRRFMPGLYVQYVKFKGEDGRCDSQCRRCRKECRKHRFVPSCPKLVALSQVCPKMFFRHREDAIAIMRAVKLEALPTTALMKLVNEKNRNRFKRNLLSHLIDAELVVPTLTDAPSSPKQSYSLTEKGKELLNNNEV